MKGSENAGNDLDEMTRRFSELAGPGSKTAMGVLLFGFAESRLPEGQRICYDPYAVHFINPDILEWAASHPEEARAMHEKRERLLPGLGNSTVVRVRFFDDFVKRSMDEGFKQLVILGAGYDSRAYRMDGLKKITIFEVDHPATQAVKMKKIKEIFGSLPEHVTYVSADLETEDFGRRLMEQGYERSKKTLFIMEGLLYYLPPHVVDEVLSFIAENSIKGSAIIFDYIHESSVDGIDARCGTQCTACDQEALKKARADLIQQGEPYKFGIKEGAIEPFLVTRGFSGVRNVTSIEYKNAYFHGTNEGRTVCSLLYFAHAVVE